MLVREVVINCDAPLCPVGASEKTRETYSADKWTVETPRGWALYPCGYALCPGCAELQYRKINGGMR